MATSSSSSLKWALLSIPAYQIFTILPHIYALTILRANGHKLSAANPKASLAPEAIKGKVPADVFGKSLRAEAAQNNNLEQLPLYAVAVLSSIAAEKLSTRGLVGDRGGEDGTGLPTFILAFFAIRVAYTISYILIARHSKGFIRSLFWLAGYVLTIYQIYKAAALLG